ncbi:hypothetical protein CfE428DRAFT_1752 [Chthoniobacter flavus Ellin428]|uniref:Trypsin-like peptidase domain-containing protein n=1 Tax=Chthoniobacter flavus Ellin428 TaxID=497964 RepID=B4CYL4_9BACT|nr:hypothetical protein [Chthoniobacter flavus]EDY20555.1 hypothetical protein CfE428DRAFT_1752 [Chthoniobacter flavus Ellin428]TCO89932.1 hypothetical protein EV701_112107 [Chthoniobacter flavus]
MMKHTGTSWLCLPCNAGAAEAKASGRPGGSRGSGVSSISLDRIPLWGYAIIGLLLGLAYVYTPGGSKNGGGGMPQLSADVAETWSKAPVAQWPQFTLANELELKGVPKASDGYGFLLQADSGRILGVTYARIEPGLTNADLNQRFVSGRMVATGAPDHALAFRGFYGPPAAKSDSNIWLLRPADDKAPVPVTPLKIRHMASLGGMRLFIIARVSGDASGKESRIPCSAQEIGGMGELMGITCDTPTVARGLPGAPVVDKSGHLAGIVTGVGDDEMTENGAVTSLKTLGAAGLQRLIN